MFRKYVLPLLALAGLALGVVAAIKSARSLAPRAMVSNPPEPPYEKFVAGAGLAEANTENIAIGTHVPGVVSRVYVQIGSPVKRGDPLFTIDDRAALAKLAVEESSIGVAQSQLASAQYEFKIGTGLVAKKVISSEDADLRRYAAETAAAQLRLAQAEANATRVEVERLTVHSPIDGQVLQMKLHPGEFAPAGVQQQPLMLLGGVRPMNVRVNVDENDAWRVRAGARATGFLRGNKEIHAALEFVRFEPYVVPKTSLTGGSNERVDTRVLQVIFSFEKGSLPIFVGQQMDIYIDAGPVRDPAHAANVIEP